MKQRICTIILCSLTFCANNESMAQHDELIEDAPRAEDSNQQEQDASGTRVPTMGGRQFWGDVVFFHGWRIQQNVLTKHFRLLDPDDVRHATGTRTHCEARLEAIRKEQKLDRMSGRAVLLIHGIGRSSKSFSGMAKALQADDCVVVGFDYPSTRVKLQESANYLHSVILSLDGIESFDVVCHSMGGLLLRTYLLQHGDPGFHRAVMLGVPNKGAWMADRLKRNPLFRSILGPAGQQLVTDEEGLISQLPVPDFPFGVLAGGRGAARGYNPVLPGDNDSTVSVSSTRLPGATDFILLPVIHSFLMSDSRCIAATQHFLKHGRFEAERPANPISPADINVKQ